ncbi:MAG: signal peptidase I [bacterium]
MKQDTTRAGTRDSAPPAVREAVEWIKTIIPVLCLFLLLRATVVQSYVIPTGSMAPTVMPGDRIFGLRFVYLFREPRRGEIVAFQPPARALEPGEKRFSFLKRVIAVENDVVSVRGGKVFVNGVALDEPYVGEPPRYVLPPARVPRGMLFVLGDNRNRSKDSHVWGFLPADNVRAKAFIRFWPPARAGLVR